MKSMIGIVTGLFILSGTGLFLPLSAENGNQEGPPPANPPVPGIGELRERLESRYDYEHAPGTLEEAFRKRGVTGKTVLGYAKPWGRNELYLQWSRLVENRTGTRESLLKVEGIMKERVKLHAEKAYWLDQIHIAQEEQKKIRNRYWKLWERNPTEYNRQFNAHENRKNKELRPWKIKEAEAQKNANGVPWPYSFTWKGEDLNGVGTLKLFLLPFEKNGELVYYHDGFYLFCLDLLQNGSESTGKKPGERTGTPWKLNPPSRFDRDGDGRLDPLPKR